MYEMTNDEFINIVNNVLERHAPLRYKYFRANDAPFMSKERRKVVILRPKLLNRFNRGGNGICEDCVQKAKSDYYSNLDPRNITLFCQQRILR